MIIDHTGLSILPCANMERELMRSWYQKFILVVFVALCCSDAQAQIDQSLIDRGIRLSHERKFDSLAVIAEELLGDYQNEPIDEKQAYGRFFTADMQRRRDPKLSRELIDPALEYWTGTRNKLMQARSISLIGNIVSSTGKQEEAYNHYLRTIELLDELEDSEEVLNYKGRIHYNAGFVQLKFSNLEKAAFHINESKQVAIEVADTFLLANVYNLLGNVGMLTEDLDQALADMKTGYQLATKINSKTSIYLLSGIANVYTTAQNIDSALFYAEKVVEMKRGGLDQISLLTSISNLSEIYRQKEDCAKSDELSEEVVERASAMGANHLVVGGLINLCQCAADAGRWSRGVSFARQAEELLPEAFEQDMSVDLHECAMRCYEGLGDYESAFYHQREHKSSYDSIFSRKSIAAIDELKVKHRTELKEQEILNLQQQAEVDQARFQQWMIFLIGLILIALLAGTGK